MQAHSQMHHLNVTALGPAHQLHLNTVETRHRQKSLAHNVLSGGTAKGQAAPPTHLQGPQHRYWSSSEPGMCLWSCACGRLKAAQVWTVENLNTRRRFLGARHFRKAWHTAYWWLQRDRKREACIQRTASSLKPRSSVTAVVWGDTTEPSILAQDFCSAIAKSHSKPRWNRGMANEGIPKDPPGRKEEHPRKLRKTRSMNWRHKNRAFQRFYEHSDTQ